MARAACACFNTFVTSVCVNVHFTSSWLAFEGRDFTGRMYLLELGSYPDLRAMGCANAKSSILSLQTVGFVSSL